MQLRRRSVSYIVAAACSAVVVGGLAIALASTSVPAAVRPGVVVSAKQCATNRAAGPITFVSPFSYDASAGILDVFDAQSLGYYAAECIQVNFVTTSYTPTELVSVGKGTITGEGSAADDLVQVASGAHITAIATFGDTSDYALLTAPSIANLTDLEGHSVGYHEVFPAILRALMERAGVNLSRVHFVNDNSYNPALLDQGAFQGLQAYQSNEPLTLRAEHLGFHEYTPAQYKVPGTFNVMVVNSTFLADHPSTVTDFLRAELHAFDYCVTNEARCIHLEQAVAEAHGVSYDYAHSLAEWSIETNLAEHHTLAGAGVGVESLAEWQPEANMLVSQHLIAKAPTLSRIENTSIAASLYSGTKLIWP